MVNPIQFVALYALVLFFAMFVIFGSFFLWSRWYWRHEIKADSKDEVSRD